MRKYLKSTSTRFQVLYIRWHIKMAQYTHGKDARCSANESKQDINRQIRELKAAGAEEILFEYEHRQTAAHKGRYTPSVLPTLSGV